ncbi:hypothetical protein DL93DRAFT_2093731 [Clavulina sp. PMI_390]|nr:hypothetical protein DL93DRAFT_2093731 [Clavulina sp. PMI_390]
MASSLYDSLLELETKTGYLYWHQPAPDPSNSPSAYLNALDDEVVYNNNDDEDETKPHSPAAPRHFSIPPSPSSSSSSSSSSHLSDSHTQSYSTVHSQSQSAARRPALDDKHSHSYESYRYPYPLPHSSILGENIYYRTHGSNNETPSLSRAQLGKRPMPYPSPSSNACLSQLDAIDAFDMARATYYELLDWRTDLTNQADDIGLSAGMLSLPESDFELLSTFEQFGNMSEGAALLHAEMRRVNAAIVKQAQVMQHWAKIVARPSRGMRSRSSRHPRSFSTSSSASSSTSSSAASSRASSERPSPRPAFLSHSSSRTSSPPPPDPTQGLEAYFSP